MEQIEIDNYNVFIAKFMGYKFIADGNCLFKDDNYPILLISELKFHTDWNQLITVVERIEEMDYGFKMCRKVVEVYIDSTKETIIYVKEKNRTESLYLAVIKFIEWYNNEQNN